MCSLTNQIGPTSFPIIKSIGLESTNAIISTPRSSRTPLKRSSQNFNYFVNAFAEVKEGVTDPLFFEPGVTDEQIDDRVRMDGIPITNDLRELLKVISAL